MMRLRAWSRTFGLLAPLAAIAALGWPAAARPFVAATIRGRVDVPAGSTATNGRPDVAALSMSMHDTVDRRRCVVYLDPAPRPAFDPGDEPHARMDQRNEGFVPHVLPIVVGSWVDFPNDDRTYHNVFSLSKTRPFNLGRYAAGRSKSVRFDRPGIVRVFCDIHSHMSAFIIVFAHRYFSVTDDEGRYHVGNVPPGTYNVAVWNEAHASQNRRVTVPDGGGDVEADFTLR